MSNPQHSKAYFVKIFVTPFLVANSDFNSLCKPTNFSVQSMTVDAPGTYEGVST